MSAAWSGGACGRRRALWCACGFAHRAGSAVGPVFARHWGRRSRLFVGIGIPATAGRKQPANQGHNERIAQCVHARNFRPQPPVAPPVKGVI